MCLALFYLTFILSFILLNLFSPIPGTFINSSIFLNFPFSSLYCIIVVARVSPIPFKFCNSLLSALFIFIVLFCSFVSVCVIPLFVSSIILICSSLMLGIYIFCPSSSSYAKFTFFIFAFSVSPPAFSIASAILLPSF